MLFPFILIEADDTISSMSPGVPHKNILVLTLPRSGSGYLSHLLRRHHLISFHHEYLMPQARREERLMEGGLGRPGLRFMTHLVLHRAKRRDLRRFLASAPESSLVGASTDPFAEGFSAAEVRSVINPATRVVLLTRENALKQYISILNVRAEREAGNPRPGKSYHPRAETTDRQFRIGREDVLEIARLEDQRRRLLEMAAAFDVPPLRLTYERDINNPEAMPLLQKLAEFLDIDLPDTWRSLASNEPGPTGYHKIVSDDLRRVIENYDEVAADPATARYL